MNREQNKSNNKNSVDNKNEDINKTLKSISDQLKVISKVIERSKSERKWRCYDYQEISTSINEIKYASGITLQSLKTCNITLYNNWTEKVAENKALIKRAEEEVFSQEQ